VDYTSVIFTALVALLVNIFFAAAKYLFKGYAYIFSLILIMGTVAVLLYIYGTGRPIF
jgi:hypothetical protein